MRGLAVTGIDRHHGPDPAVDQTGLLLLPAPSIVGELHAVADREHLGPAGNLDGVILQKRAALPVNLAGKPVEHVHLVVGVGEDEPLPVRVGRDVAGILPLQGLGGLLRRLRPLDRTLPLKNVQRLTKFTVMHQIEGELLVRILHPLHRVQLGRPMNRR